MTVWIAWILCACAVLLWPPDLRSTRIRSLMQSGRLAVPVPVGGAALGLTLPRVRAGPLALLCGCGVGVASWRPVGSVAALEFAAAAMVAAHVAVTGLLAAVRERRRRDRLRELHGAVGVLCAELDAGTAPVAALAAAGQASPVWNAELLAIETVLDSDHPPRLAPGAHDPLGPLQQAWQVAGTTGTPLAAVLDRVRADLSAEQEAARAVAGALAGPRSSAALLGLLPLLGVGLGAAMGAHPLTTLFAEPAGRALLCAGCVLDAVGVFWTRLLVRSASGR